MKHIFLRLSLILILIQSISCLSNAEVERIYFELDGVWVSSEYYGVGSSNFGNTEISHYWGIFSYSKDDDFYIDLTKELIIDSDYVDDIQILSDIYKVGIKTEIRSFSNNFYYIQPIDENRIRLLAREDSIVGVDQDLVRITGPRSVVVDYSVELKNNLQEIYLLPTTESKVIGRFNNKKTYNAIKMTLRPNGVEDYIHWVKIIDANGNAGWVPRSELRIAYQF
ncbi:MAG: hypothetical protein PQJ50_07555 [Spirochaetales bacterium]|nr:hypothetical protein [Spirochaetales bacterium]